VQGLPFAACWHMAAVEAGATAKVAISENKRGHRKFDTYDLPDWVQHPLKEQPAKAALLFPGEQNHAVGMFAESSERPAVRRMLDAASNALGLDVEELALAGPAKDMVPARINQPLMYLAGCAAFEVAKELHPDMAFRCQAVAGFGIGEVTALYAAGVVSFDQGLQIARVRGEALQDFSDQSATAALIVRGTTVERLDQAIKSVAKQNSALAGQVHIARHDFPGGFLCAGSREAVRVLHETVAGQGVEARVLPDLPAAYTPLAKEAAAKVAATIRAMAPRMRPPRCDLFLNRTGLRVRRGRSPASFADELAAQLEAPILWSDCITEMLRWGVRAFLECGPNRSLKYMLSRHTLGLECPPELLTPVDFTENVAA